jgi:glycosyltransferase involved in cell wall biosynthesis/GT2 family glycosyltransferase
VYPTISIVINTLNRGPLLAKTLDSFRWLKYAGEFEVIVVNGPSTDNSDEVIAAWLPHIRAGKCDVPNLSISRNIGICMAKGDIVAFIDDDAIPEPEWLEQLARAYDTDGIGGAGGLVFDQSGYTYQYEYSTATRLANANWSASGSAEHLSFPGSFEFPYLQGTNASFRRSALLEVGGFDEELEYYLDETELCCRLIDAGFIIRQLPDAMVHHKFAPSNVRDEHKITRYRYPVIKNKIYFAIKHARAYLPLQDILDDNKKFSEKHAADVEFHIAGGRLAATERQVFKDQNERAWERGVQRGLSGQHEYITEEKLKKWDGQFLPFTRVIRGQALKSIVLVSRDFPPNHSGGIATFSRDLAQSLAAQGHIVHVIAQSPDINRVDFENGVWVHRMVMRSIERSPEALARRIPEHIWSWSAIALEEARRIATHRRIDVVEAPVWDGEGVAFLLDGTWPLVTSLHTTLHFWMESHPEKKRDQAWLASFGNPMLQLETDLMTRSCAVRANSQAIVDEIERSYHFTFDKTKTRVVPHGMARRERKQGGSANAGTEILFVGRLEQRKGIDVLLAAIPTVMETEPQVRFRIIGDDSLAGPDGKTFRAAFVAQYAKQPWFGNVRFEGRVDDTVLDEAYANTDIFVAPSRFESFGLVFLEAMREGKAVIGCRAGGMPEVVQDEVTGLLVAPGDAAALTQAILRLVRDPGLRASMGDAGYAAFAEKFTSERMAEGSAVLYALAQKNSGARAK